MKMRRSWESLENHEPRGGSPGIFFRLNLGFQLSALSFWLLAFSFAPRDYSPMHIATVSSTIFPIPWYTCHGDASPYMYAGLVMIL